MVVPQADPQAKVPVVRRPEYTLYFEQAARDHTFIHCDVYTWSPRVVRQLTADWQAVQALHGGPIFALHTPGDRKHLKFITLFGFKLVAAFVADDGPRELFST